MSFASDMQDLATEMLTDLGNAATFHVPYADGYDAATGDRTLATYDVPVKVSPPEGYASALVDGDMVQQRDRKVLVSAEDLAFTPSPGVQTLTLAGDVYQIVRVDSIMAQDTVVAHEVQIR